MAKALKLEIYKSKFGDCSNGGISSRFNEVLILCPDGNYEVDLENPPENLCILVKREILGEIHMHVEPWAKANGVGWMAGGCVVDTPDSRWSRLKGNYYPLKLHDRMETQKDYDDYCR